MIAALLMFVLSLPVETNTDFRLSWLLIAVGLFLAAVALLLCSKAIDRAVSKQVVSKQPADRGSRRRARRN
jgi:protein-S-isoprenylcysteine O-methyltransferase Ste14